MSRRGDFLRDGKVLRLATVDGGGAPHVVPVWYIYEGGTIYVGTNTRTKKAQNVAATGTAAFCVDEGVRSPLYGVMGRGDARLLTDTGEVGPMALRILARYFDDVSVKEAQALYKDTDCIIAVRADSLTDWT